VNRPWLLLNPGPVTLSERVRQSLLQPDLCHRESEFFDLQEEIRARLLQIYGLDPQIWAAVLLTGSGTAAVEAMIASVLPPDSRLLVIENGVYGERISRMAQLHGIVTERLHHEWTAPIDLERVRERLGREPRISHVAAVHHETTTGRLNALDALAALCSDRGVVLLADTVSSFGAEAIDFRLPAYTALAAAANKCLHGVPGASFVILRRAALAKAQPRGLYLDLAHWCREQDRRGTPFTPAVHAYYALREALHEFADEGGWTARHARYRALAGAVAQGFARLGIRPLLEAQESSVVLRAYLLPQALDYERLHDGLKARGFVIYAGQGGLARELFRISTMGALGTADMQRLVRAVGDLLAQGSALPERR
jgi:2-aminoethylphosphonate-pyruvate transaminase